MILINTDYTMCEVSPSEVLKSLGWKSQTVSGELLEKTQEMIKLLKTIARPRSAIITGNLENNGQSIAFYDIDVASKDLAEFLIDCETAALMAVTLGLEVDRTIKKIQAEDLTAALILDAAASILVEKVCDKVSENLEKSCAEQNLYTTERYSPGYGDCPLNVQPDILKLLDTTRKLGLTCSDSNLLLPRKSVTAFIGIRRSPRKPKFDRCSRCRLQGECKYGLCQMELNNENTKTPVNI